MPDKKTNKIAYYENIEVSKKLISSMRGREVTFMDGLENWKCIRGLNILHDKFLYYFFDCFNFYDKNYNIYISVAKFKNIPVFTLNLSQRSKETSGWFFKEAVNLITEYDLLLDFDSHGFYMAMKEEISYLLTLFMRRRVPFFIIPSGNNFQIVIPGEFISVPENVTKWDYIRRITENMKLVFNLKYLDLRGIGTYNKIMKCPFSLVNSSICVPFNDSDIEKNFKEFTYEDVDIKKILKVGLNDRYLKVYNDFGREKNMINFRKFINLYFLE